MRIWWSRPPNPSRAAARAPRCAATDEKHGDHHSDLSLTGRPSEDAHRVSEPCRARRRLLHRELRLPCLAGHDPVEHRQENCEPLRLLAHVVRLYYVLRQEDVPRNLRLGLPIEVPFIDLGPERAPSRPGGGITPHAQASRPVPQIPSCGCSLWRRWDTSKYKGGGQGAAPRRSNAAASVCLEHETLQTQRWTMPSVMCAFAAHQQNHLTPVAPEARCLRKQVPNMHWSTRTRVPLSTPLTAVRSARPGTR